MGRRKGLAAVVAAVAAVGLAAPAYALTVTTQNVRLGLTPAHARHDIRQAAQRSGVVLAQEMRGRDAARFRPPGYWSTQTQPRGDCATFWDRSRWRFVSRAAVPYEFGTFPRGHRWALVTVLRSVNRPGVRLATVNVHSVTRSLSRPVVFGRGMARLGRLAASLAAAYGRVVVGGDTNRTWPLRARLPGFRTVRPPRATGPKGGTVDYLYWSGPLRFRNARVIAETYSDHNGARYRLGGV